MYDCPVDHRPSRAFVVVPTQAGSDAGRNSPPRFAQRLLRNAGQLVCIDPSLGMAELLMNSAILTAVRPSAVLASAPNSRPGRGKWQTLWQSLPSLRGHPVEYRRIRKRCPGLVNVRPSAFGLRLISRMMINYADF